ncbi:MFS transporter [Polluticoccus soli]|uniref:MFS transporter n=1 Tax=Polluticoccus soli TaxID=3034150 RepID=UPI0023E0F0CE|nr:MFS transporter [Flavipsychrobacter sp. JY13-12]
MGPLLSFLVKNKTLNYPLFRKYLMLRFSMIMSLNMQMTIVSYMVYQLTHDELSLGLLGLWEVIPAFGFSLVSGPYTDHREKRTLLLQCVAGYLLLSAFYVMLALPDFQKSIGTNTTVWLIYGGVFIGGMLRAFLSPSNFALMGLIVPKRLYANATTWSSTAWQFGAVIGPLLGGSLLALSGFTWSLASVVGIQLIGLAAIMTIPRLPLMMKGKEPIIQSLKSGLKFVFNTQVILAALSLDMFAVLFGGAVALLPVYADDILKVGEAGYGLLRAAPGIGAIICLFILSFVPLKTKAGAKLLSSIALFGITTIIFGVSGEIASIAPLPWLSEIFGFNISWAFLLAFFMLLLGGLFDSVSVIIRGTILQLYTPDHMRGRVASVNTMFISSSNELGALESGFTAKWMGTVPAVVFGGIMTLVVVGVTYIKAPLLSSMKLDPNEKDKT